MGKLAKNYLYSIVYQIFVLIVPLVTAPYLTRTLGATNMGTYSYINSYASIVSTISLLGIYNYGVRQLAYVRDNKKEFNKTFWEINALRLILAIIGSFCYFLMAKDEYNYVVLLYYPWMIASYIDLSWLFVAVEDMRPAVLKNFFAKLITVIGIFAFVKTRDQLWVYIFLLSVSTFIANVSLFSQVKKYISKPQIDIHNYRKHLSGTFVLFLPQIASLLYLQIDKVMMEGLTGNLDQISFYDQAEKIVKIPMTFITVMSTVMMPRLANEFNKGNTKKIEEYLSLISRFSLALSFPMIIGMITIAKQFVPWYLGTEYLPTATAIIIISPIILSNSLTGISGSQYFIATNQMNIVILSNIAGAALNIIVNALLIPQYGYIGAAVASVFASYLIVVMQYIRLNKDIRVKVLLKPFPKYLINSLVMGGVIYCVTQNMDIKPYTTLIQIVVGIAAYIILLIVEKDSLIFECVKIIRGRIKKRKDEIL